ncbi:odorant receptor 4-like [Calliopsis andreniformis]|uniref:odorant receptor 4-like n=1 Tax=Calliopsis andreniformis TaxID=337506 RepID=UPI003FCD330C
MLDSSDEVLATNATHLKDYEYSVQLNRWFLKPIGAWPRLKKSTKTNKVLVKLLNFACHSLIIFTFAPSLLYILFEDTNMYAKMRAIGPMSYWLMGELNYCCLLMKQNDILLCVKHIENDWCSVRHARDRQLMLKNAKIGRFIACIAALCLNLGVLLYNTIGFRKTVFHVGNESHTMYRLPCPFYTNLMEVRYSPMNEIVFGLQLLSGVIVNCTTMGACGLAAILAMHACGQLSVVMSRLEEMVDNGNEQPSAQEKLAFIVDHHLRTLSFVTYIEKVMNLICLVQLMGCTLNLCMLEYYVLTEKSKDTMASYGILYTSMTINIFIFCYIGEILTEQCKKVGEKAYMTEWYRLPYKTAAGLILVISRSSTVTKITAGKLVNISIATFSDVFKTSFAYFNMLRTVAM